jgi:hypothetical protein
MPRITISASSSLSIAESPSSGNDECAARPARVQADAQDAAGGDAEAVVGRLPVDQVLHAGRRTVVGDSRAVAAPLLAGKQQQRDPPLTGGAQPLRRSDLRRQDALGVARAAPEDEAALLAAREKNGGTQSKWVEKTTCGSASSRANTLKRPLVTGCSVTS